MARHSHQGKLILTIAERGRAARGRRLAHGDYRALATNLTTAFSVTALGLLIGGLAFTISIVRDRIYCEDPKARCGWRPSAGR